MAPQLHKKRAASAKLIHVIRHGESQHNVCEKFLRKSDTRLTYKGRCQAKSLRHKLRKLRPQVAVTSDILRALQTTRAMGFSGPIVVKPDAREKAGWPCNGPIDPRRAVSGDLAQQFGTYDWSIVLRESKAADKAKRTRSIGVENSPTNVAVIHHEKKSKVGVRARKLTAYLERRPEHSIALVSHGEFIERLTGDNYMQNCEVRTYRLWKGKWRLLKQHACRI